MKTVIQRILTVVALVAMLPTAALPMKSTFEDIIEEDEEDIEETSNDNQNQKKTKDKILLPNDILEKILSFIVNDRGFVILTKEIKTLSLTSQVFNTKISEMMHEPFQLLIQSNSSVNNMLSPIDADKLCSYLDIFFSKIITMTSINEEAFSILNKFIKNNHARSLFASQLISRLRTIICQANHLSIKTRFNSLQHEGMLKWALRFVYNEVMANTDTPCIDNNNIVDSIRLKINELKDQKLDLSWINDNGQFGQQLQNFLTDAHELIEPLCSEMLNGAPLLSLDLAGNFIVTIPDFSNLSSLQVLDLHSNRIVTVHDFSNLSCLRDLDLSWNLIATVPNFKNLSSLKLLELFNNRIAERTTLNKLPEGCNIRW